MHKRDTSFHQHKKNADATALVIKVSTTCRFSCLALSYIMNEEAKGACSFHCRDQNVLPVLFSLIFVVEQTLGHMLGGGTWV